MFVYLEKNKMNKGNSINKRDLLYNEILPYRKNNLKIEKDFNENFPKIISKYSSSYYNQNESKLTNNTNILTIHKNENINQSNKKNVTLSKVKKIIKNKFLLNIKNIEIEDIKDKNNNNYINNKFQTLTDININKILEKKKKNNLILNSFKEKNSDIIPSNKNLENKFTYSIKNKKISDINLSNNSDKDIDNKFTNIGINNKFSKTALNFHPQKNNKVIYSYQTKDKEINKYNNNSEKKHKVFYSRNVSNNFRTIISSDNKKTIDYKMSHNISIKNNNSIKDKTNVKNNLKINNIVFKTLSNQMFRKIELSNQMNKKISDINVQNLLMKEIEEIEKIKRNKHQINENKNLINVFNNKSIKYKLFNMNSDGYEKNNNNKKNQNEKNLENNTERKEIISKLKTIDLFTDIQMFDDNFEPNEELIKLYREYKKELLNDKDVILELGQYFISLFAPKNKKNKNISKKKFQNKIIKTDLEELNENEKSTYNEEEKNIIQDIIYELSNDLNENIELYKRNPNRNKSEKSLKINNITLAKLFEKLNKMQNVKRKSSNKLISNKKEDNNNNNINHNDNKMNISLNEINESINNNNTDEDNEENKKLLNDILFNFIEDKKPDNKEKKLNNKLYKIIENKGNLLYDEKNLNIPNDTKILNKEKPTIKNSVFNSNAKEINIKKNESNLSRIKKKEKRRIDINKHKEKNEEKNSDNKSQNPISILFENNYLDLNNNENEYNINTERYKRNDLNDDNIEIINEESLLNKELDGDNISSSFEDDDDNNINKNKKEKKPNIANKSQNKEKYKKTIKKEVKFNENNNNSPNSINNNEYFLLSNNDSLFSSPEKKKRFHFSSMNGYNYEENDDNSDTKYRKYLKKGSITQTLYKRRKKQFQKTRKDKTKTNRLINIKNEEDINKKQEEIPVDIREEMLNRKLRNFFGKINMLKNSNMNNYDEQLKMFIDNEIDKLNDWETKEQELRINNFFSDLKLMKKRFKIGSEIKYVNPSSFSINIEKFK